MKKVYDEEDGDGRSFNGSYMWFSMYYPNGVYREGTQYYTYDFNTFMSDLGGYLGLLLGYSIASISEVTQEFFTNLIKQLAKRVKISRG